MNSMLGSVFFVVYAIGRLINGTLSERFSARNMIAGGLLLGALAFYRRKMSI